MFADLRMPVLAVKPFPKDTFIRVLFGRLVSWNLTINSGIQFVVSVCTHRDVCTRAIRSVAESCLQMTGVCQFAVKPHSRCFHSTCYLNTLCVERDSHTVAFFSWCRRTDTCLWTKANRSVVKSCLLCVCKYWQSNHSQRILSFELLFWALYVGPDSLAVAFKSWCRGTDTGVGARALNHMPSHVCWFAYASFGSQAIPKGYFHSSSFWAPCFLEPDNQQWHSICCFCMHA